MTHIAFLSSSLGILFLGCLFWYYTQEVKRRRDVEILLRQTTERERLVTQIAQQIRQSLDLNEVLTTTVAEVQQFLQADRVVIYRFYPDGTGRVTHETVLSPYPKILSQQFEEEVFPQGCHQAYALGKTRSITNIDQADVEPCLAEFVKQFDVRAKLVVPIIQNTRTDDEPAVDSGAGYGNVDSDDVGESVLWGVLIVHQCRQPRVWKSWEVELIEQLATQVAIALQQSELYNQLQQLNTQLEQRVQQRTAELAATNRALQAEVSERQRTEQALLHKNETLNALITASPRAIFMLDLDGNVKIWNPAAERIFGWRESEVLDRPSPVSLETPWEDCDSLQTCVLEGQTYTRVEMRRRHKDGTEIDLICSAAPLNDTAGNTSGIVAVIVDISEQKKRAQELRLLQSVVVNTNDAVIITEAEPFDEPGPRILYVNEAFTHITGYAPEEVLGQTPRILQGPKTDRAELHRVRQALSRWEPVTVEVINYRKNGSEFWNEFSLVPVADTTGWYTHWIAVQRDTTERKRTEQALLQREKNFRTLIENALDIIMILDLEGTIHYVSPSVKKVLGYSSTDLIGQNVASFIHPDDWATQRYMPDATLRDLLIRTTQQPDLQSPIEFRFRHQKSTTWPILEAVSQPFIDAGDTLRVIVNARDITERKRLDETRLALEREKELSNLKTRFFSMASHEFRTPLSTALAAAQLLENSQSTWEDTTKRARNLNRIQDSIRNTVQLLDDILTINRAESGNLAFNPKPLALQLYCDYFVEEMQLSAGEQHSLHFISEGEAYPISLDEKLLRSILSNLLSNAIKYSPNGGTITLKLVFSTESVTIDVSDQGIGIPLDDQKQLFEPFQRGKNIRNMPGTGLGLAVVKKCVDLHQGKIEIVSEVGVGTTCSVTLPYR
ncbi:MAG: PAS domain S-box protein [Cyanobacteria bacterium P01_D01_bin.105]